MTYKLAQMEEYKDIMTAVPDLTGKRINRFATCTRSREDLIMKVKMQRLVE